jgi:hypothetical protein
MSKPFLLATCLATIILGACSGSDTNPPSTTEPNASGASVSEPELPQEIVPQPPPLIVAPESKGEKSMSSTPQVELKLMPSGDAPREEKTENSSPDQNLAAPLPQSNLPQTAAPETNTNLPGSDNPFQAPQTETVPLENSPLPQTTAPIINTPTNSVPQAPVGQQNLPTQP